MTGGPVPSVRVVLPPQRERRERLYRAIAGGLAAAPYRAAVVLEASSDRPWPELWLTPRELVEPVLSTPAFADLDVRSSAHDERPPGSGERWEAYWELAPWTSPAPPAPSDAASDRPCREALLGTSGRIETQTFWLSGREDGRLWAARRVRYSSASAAEVERRGTAVAAFASAEWSRASGVLCRPRPIPGTARAWLTAVAPAVRRGDWLALPVPIAARTAEPALPQEVEDGPAEDGHTVVLGSSGAGKTTFLAGVAARAIRDGAAVVGVDLHGDLAPAIVARLGTTERARVVAVDAGRRPVVGVAALAGSDPRAAAQFVAAVKRLSPDGSELYWGFRLERIFDSFVRLVQESGGTLTDLYALLTDADRREAARLATGEPELARFLEELGPIVRRSPEFLWSAAARLAKVVLVPELAELLAPADAGVPLEELVASGRSVLVRVPFTALGPEAASFAGSLIVARAYLGVAARRGPGGSHRPLVVVLDEVQGLAPRLVAEMLAEGRKFGLRLVIATQYPERLAPELRAAAMGVSRGVVAFRVPRASAAVVGAWLGLSPNEAERQLPDLPTGLGVARDAGSGELRPVGPGATPPEGAESVWEEVAGRTLREYPPRPVLAGAERDDATERLLLAILAGEERGTPVRREEVVDRAMALPAPPIDRALLEDRKLAVERARLTVGGDDGLRLSPAGERTLGLHASTGASRESAEHRALLLRTFRLFARHGHRLEIVRQGRYDTTLPDARFRQLSERAVSRSPRELAAAVEAARRGWAWRCFHGLDVHVEAEVSGALRPARIEHGLDKAQRRGAYALFVVGEPAHAARVRRALRARGVGSDRAQVWTLGAHGRPPASSERDRKGSERSGGS